MDQRQRRMFGHGAIVMIFGLVAGFGLTMSLIGGFEIFPGTIVQFDLPGDDRAWARTHVGGLMNGLLVMVGALVMWGLQIPERSARHLYWMLIGTGYANTIFYWAGMLAPNRAVSFGDNPLGPANLASVVGLLPAFVFAFVAIAAMVMIAVHAFAKQTRVDGG